MQTYEHDQCDIEDDIVKNDPCLRERERERYVIWRSDKIFESFTNRRTAFNFIIDADLHEIDGYDELAELYSIISTHANDPIAMAKLAKEAVMKHCATAAGKEKS